MSEPNRLSGSRPVVVTLLIVVLAAVAVGGIVLSAMDDVRRAMHDGAADMADAARVVPSLITWGLAAMVVLASLLLACMLAVRSMGRALAHEPRLRDVLRVGVPLVAAALGVLELRGAPTFGRAYEILGPVAGLPEHVHAAARVLGSLGFVTTLIVAAAVVALCRRPPRASEQDLAWRVATLRLLLYVAAAGLAGGTLATEARLGLQLPADLGEADLQHAHEVVRAASLGYGGLFTLFLVAAFLPASRALGAAGVELFSANGQGAEQSQDEWLAARGLKSNVSSTVVQILAALAPLLTHSVSTGLAGMISGAVG